MKEKDPLETVGTFGARIDARAEAFLKPNEYALYGMLRYFMGYADNEFKPIAHPVGKRLRPGLLLLIAESYGALDAALGTALSIELFHNFTLIHDDVVDHDELRRGRPTVWKLWGIDHAINTGDAQLLLSLAALDEPTNVPAERLTAVRKNLTGRYLEVIEGQYLDFTLASQPLTHPTVSIESYLTMIDKKTAKLIRAATETAPMLVGRSDSEVQALGEFGGALGMAYQLYDDWQSIWGDEEKTGKKRAGDIVERKKTLPVIYAHMHLALADQKRLEELYEGEAMGEEQVEEILTLLAKTGAKDELEGYAARYKDAAIEALASAALASETKTLLESIVRALVPDFVTGSR